MKRKLTTALVLACPGWTKPLVLQTDARMEGLGAVLSQPDGEREHIIAYTSRPVSKTDWNYSATELECLAVKWGIWRMREYLAFWPTGALGHGTEPVGLRVEVSQGDGQPGGRRPIEATHGDVRR